jgi:hypothetical protein
MEAFGGLSADWCATTANELGTKELEVINFWSPIRTFAKVA